MDPSHGASRATAGWLGFNGTFSRREFLLWLACILFASQLLFIPAGDPGTEATTFADALLSKSVFYYLGWYVVCVRLLASKADQPASVYELALGLFLAAVNVLPGTASTWLAATGVALFLLFSSRSDDQVRAAAVVLLALSVNGYWGPKIFDLFAYYLLRADAALVGAVLHLTQPGMGWHDTIIGHLGGHTVLIFGPCSSFHNISLGLLCWVSILKLTRTSWVRKDFAVAFAIVLTVILLNAVRLYLIALSSEQYEYWHRGPGEQIVAWATTMAVLAISLWGVARTGESR